MPAFPLRRLLHRAPAIVLVVVLLNVLPLGPIRSALASCCVALAGPMGLELSHLSGDLISLPGWPMQIGVACTMLDYYFGFAVFVWSFSKSAVDNLRILLPFFPLLMAINLLRLLSGFWLFQQGVPWVLAHEVMIAFIYFGLTEWAFHLVAGEEAGRSTPLVLRSADG